MNITLPLKPAMTMDAPVIFINSYGVSYTSMIIYGCFALMVFIGIVIGILVFKRGG
jgi:hypothetical protein